jgi:hypothetical protein
MLLAGCLGPEIPRDAQIFERDWGTWKARQEGPLPAPVREDRRDAVTDAAAWRALWSGEAPSVDFGKSVALVAAVKLVEHPKDVPRIWRVREDDGGGLTVFVRVRQVGGDFRNEFAGAPGFHYVVVQKPAGEVRWRDIEVVYDQSGEVDSFRVLRNYDE